MNENKDEIVVGVNIPNESKYKDNKKKNKTHTKTNKKEVAKKATSKYKKNHKDKKNKARIFGKNKIFRNRLIKKIIILCLIIIAIIIFMASSFFDIKKIQIENNEIVSENEIIALSQLSDKTNIFSVSENSLKTKIKQNSYISDAKIKRVLPNTLIINITERKIKYMIELGDAYIYIDNQGYILDISNEKKNIPILSGIKTDATKLNKKGIRLVNEDLNKLDTVNTIYESANNNGILPIISKIDISDSKNYTLYLESEKKIVYLGNGSNLNTKMLYINAILEQEKGIEGEIFVNVDLNEDNVFFREKI